MKHLIFFSLKIYKFLSLVIGRAYYFLLFPSQCKFYPSCSQYAKEAVERHGVAKGSSMAISRVIRCNPWSKPGVDTPF